MFRSVSEDAGNMAMTMAMATTPLGAGRRRTRAQARLDVDARRERLKRTREAMEAMSREKEKRQQTSQKPLVVDTSGLATPPRGKSVVLIGASFGDNLAIKHTTPTKKTAPSPSALTVRLNSQESPQAENDTSEGEETTATRQARRAVPCARGIAQSSSTTTTGGGSSRKRMISFSPERTQRPVNEEAERLKMQRNLKATEKLAMRLEGRTPEKPEAPLRLLSPQLKRQRATPSPMTMSMPKTVFEMNSSVMETPKPRTETPSSRTMELLSHDGSNDREAELRASRSNTATCKKELDFTAAEGEADAAMEELKQEPQSVEEEQETSAQEVMSQEDARTGQSSQTMQTAEDAAAEVQCTIGFGGENSTQMDASFTSTSVIEDVGLFNCDTDAEYTGGVYGEGTDGKVSAATVRGQKVALKRAKPHEGFPEEEAKRRSAIELHYLRKVRHIQGFVQCLGLCDGIEHTCIALEVMDCKLSDYLRRYGIQNHGKSSSKRRCFTLSMNMTKAMLRQICQPMAFLHDQVNVAHGDLACRNVLLRMPPKGYEQKWEPVVKLSDFGRIKTATAEPPIFDAGFSFYKNCDVGCFAREILYRLLVGEIVPTNCTETRNLHKHLQDVVVERIPEAAKEKLGPYYRLFMRCAGWGVRPSFREIIDHLDDLEYFETTENGLFPLKPLGGVSSSSSESSAAFLSPVMEGTRNKVPSSGSKGNKYETPTTANGRGSALNVATLPANPTGPTNGPRLLPAKSYTEKVPQAVNWLKARSVHPGQQLKATGSSHGTTANPLLSTPVGRPAMPKKTPPSAGVSGRSMQIIKRLQQHEKEKKKC